MDIPPTSSATLRKVMGVDGPRLGTPTVRVSDPDAWAREEAARERDGSPCTAPSGPLRSLAIKEAKRSFRSVGRRESVVELRIDGETWPKVYHTVVERREERYDGDVPSGVTLRVGASEVSVPRGYGTERWTDSATEAVHARRIGRMSADAAKFASRFSKSAGPLLAALRAAREDGAELSRERGDEKAVLGAIVDKCDADSRKEPPRWKLDDRNSVKVTGDHLARDCERLPLAAVCAAARVHAAGLSDRYMVVRYAMRAWVTDPEMRAPLERPVDDVRPGSLRARVKCMDPALRRTGGDRATALAAVRGRV